MSSALPSLIAQSDITVLEREASPYVSSSFHEVLTCRLADASVRRLLLKRGVSHAQSSHRNHGGVPYEVDVYRAVLDPAVFSIPRLYHAFVDPASGETVMLIDYIENACRLSKADASKLPEAARWIAAFHKATASRVPSLIGSINTYDADYYSGWMRRTFEFWNSDNSWLAPLDEAWDVLATELQTGATVIHGEYYPKNILVSGHAIVPIDWETAAIGAGEIDLVFLTECWPVQHRESCERAYCDVRWPDGPPQPFSRRLLIAGIYAQLLRLGHKKHLISQKEATERLRILNALCRKAGFIT